MPVLHSKTAREFSVDDEGYLQDFDDWSETVAKDLARREGIGDLSEDQLESLRFIRQHYERFHFFPIVASVCKYLHKPKGCVQEEFLNPLLAWKLAGLPHPEEPIISLLKAGQSPG